MMLVAIAIAIYIGVCGVWAAHLAADDASRHNLKRFNLPYSDPFWHGFWSYWAYLGAAVVWAPLRKSWSQEIKPWTF